MRFDTLPSVGDRARLPFGATVASIAACAIAVSSAGLGLAIAALLPATAHADAITYTDGGNVWIASPDGSVKKQLTTNGTPDGVRYFGPSQADDGRISVIFGAGLGKSSSPNIQVLSASGKLEKTGLLQMQTCGAFGANPSAFGYTRMSPGGDAILYDYICTNTGQAGDGTAGTRVYTAVTSGTSPGGAILEELRAPGGYLPTWLARKSGEFNDVLATDQYGRWIGTLSWQTPLEWTPDVWVVLGEGSTLGGASFSRTNNVFVYEIKAEDTGDYLIGAAKFDGDFAPGVQRLGECIIASSPESMNPSVSPDGSRVTWSDNEGAKVAPLTIPQDVIGRPCGGTVTTLSRTGANPVFSGAAAPTNGGGPGPNPSPGPNGGLTINGPTKATRAQVSKGLSFSTRCAKKCSVKATMSAGGKTVARASKKLKRKGTAKLKLKAKLAAGVTSVTVVVPSGGKSATRTVAVSG